MKGHKCLYISLQEDKDKLFRNVKNLGMDFKGLEEKDLLRFIKLPLMISKESIIDTFSRILKDAIISFNPKVLVIDSVTPILKVIGNDVEVRATLQNTLTEISKLINGLTVLIHEVEGDVEDLGGIGFVSDVVIFMSCKIVNNLILRDIEIKKSRGSPTRIAKVVFTIEEGEGIKVFVPPMLEEVPAPDYTKPYNHLCNSLNRKVGPVYPGEVIFLVHPNLAYVDYVLAYLTLTAIIYKAKILIISYLIPPQHIIQRILKSLEIITTKSGITEELINNYTVVKGLNPSAHLPEEAVYKVVKLLMDHKPTVVVFVGTPPLGIKPTGMDTDYNNLAMNLILYLRKLRITTIIIDDHDDELVKALSDMFISVKKCVKSKIFRIPRVSVEILRKNEAPHTVTLKDFILCAKDLRSILKRGATLPPTTEATN